MSEQKYSPIVAFEPEDFKDARVEVDGNDCDLSLSEREQIAGIANAKLSLLRHKIFEYIEHGDAEHRRWLKDKIEELFDAIV